MFIHNRKHNFKLMFVTVFCNLGLTPISSWFRPDSSMKMSWFLAGLKPRSTSLSTLTYYQLKVGFKVIFEGSFFFIIYPSIYKFSLFGCLFVCLYPINVKTAEQIGAKIFGWPQGRFMNDQNLENPRNSF